MQDLSDDERREVLGEVLHDELKVIGEYVKDVPKIQDEVHQLHTKVDGISNKLKVFKHIFKEHEEELRQLKPKAV